MREGAEDIKGKAMEMKKWISNEFRAISRIWIVLFLWPQISQPSRLVPRIGIADA